MTRTDEREPDGPDLAPPRRPAPWWLLPGLLTAGTIVLVGVGLIVWSVTHPPSTSPPKLGLSAVYTPAGTASPAAVYFTVTNSGDTADTLASAGAEFQTAAAARSVSVYPGAGGQPGAVTIPGHATVMFTAGGPHLQVGGLGPLPVGHAPLQLTLHFAASGTVHILAPIGGPGNLTQQDVMTYGYMGHRDPGMGMDMPPASSGAGEPPMTGMTMPNGG